MVSSNLKEFLLKLRQNYNTLREREAKYGTAPPLDLLNQLDDYRKAIDQAEQALAQNVPLDELQVQFSNLNLQLNMIVFVSNEPPRKPFTGENPYRGLHKFTESDANFFFGRSAVIQTLLTTVERITQTGTSQGSIKLMAVVGPSGSGKSSLVRAGLIPALRKGEVKGSENWPIKVMQPGAHPLDTLAILFIEELNRPATTIRAELNSGENALSLLMAEILTDKAQNAYFVLVIDQFEELFTQYNDETERQTFLDQLLYAAWSRQVLIMLTMRADFYGKAAAYKKLAEVITRNQMLVSPMTERELREAILSPAEIVGLELDKALVETLIKDTAKAPGALPLLQHALWELFQRRDGNVLTLKAYHKIGGVQGALAQRAKSIYDGFDTVQQEITRRVMLRLVQPGEGTEDTHRQAKLTELISANNQLPEVKAVVDQLADARLLITGKDEHGDITVDIAHEALIRDWPLLREWVEREGTTLRLHRRLTETAFEWARKQRDTSYLYLGARLAEVEDWKRTRTDDLSELEQAFLEASLSERERQQQEKDEDLKFQEWRERLQEVMESRRRPNNEYFVAYSNETTEEAKTWLAKRSDALTKKERNFVRILIRHQDRVRQGKGRKITLLMTAIAVLLFMLMYWWDKSSSEILLIAGVIVVVTMLLVYLGDLDEKRHIKNK